MNPRKFREKLVEAIEHINALEKLRATVSMPAGTASGMIQIQGGNSTLEMTSAKEIGN